VDNSSVAPNCGSGGHTLQKEVSQTANSPIILGD
jgi:hypothetical protein